jgi:isocitrate dehydrogenase
MNKTSQEPITISIAYGDGIGPEIMKAVLSILEASNAAIQQEIVEMGEKSFLEGHNAGIPAATWKSIQKNKVLLKAPITTPQGGGYKSLNVTMRKTLGLYANIRPTLSYEPYVVSKHKNIDVVIVRENEEDLYAGIEHRQTTDVTQCLKLITRPGCERIVRYAFEYAKANGRKKVSCFSKDNIMKATDGLFHQVFNEIAPEYPEIETDHWIIDIATAKLANEPEKFDVIVTLNLYGDIISDVASEIAGSVGLCGSANIGRSTAMFEAIHGSAPDIAGQNIANPSGLLHAAIQMLNHIGQSDTATTIHNAWLKTLEEGIHTADIYDVHTSQQKVGTQAFAEAVIARLGQHPERLKAVHYAAGDVVTTVGNYQRPTVKKELVGVDVFLDWPHESPNEMGQLLERLNDSLVLKMITNRGIKVYPEGFPETFCTDHWRCRFVSDQKEGLVSHQDIIQLLQRISEAGFDFIKTEGLYRFDGVNGFSVAQGE